METVPLFGELGGRKEEPASPAPTLPSVARVVEPVRTQVEMVCRDLDSFVAEEHPARAIWALLERLDLSGFYAQIGAVIGGPGRPPADPQVLLALWVYATVDGIGSARRLARLCNEHDVYRWLRGGVPINYHQLADFRTAHQQALNELLTEILTILMAEGLVSLERVAQDGMRVRASAGAASFRRARTLERLREEAQEHVERLAAEVEHPDPQSGQRQRAARQRAAHERAERVQRALEQLPAVRALKKTAEEQAAARVSTTDPEARVMKMADGGFRPAFNVQLATEPASQVIVGVAVSNVGSDAQQAEPMVEQVEQRCDQRPAAYLVDGGFANKDTVEMFAAQQVTLFAPVQKPKDPTRDPHLPLPGDSPAVAAWRQRMGTAEAKSIYKERAATAECVNGKWRVVHGLQQFPVRGTAKVLCVALLIAVAHNLLRWLALTAP